MARFPDSIYPGLPIGDGSPLPTKFLTSSELGFPEQLGPLAAKLTKLGRDKAAAMLVPWLRGELGAVSEYKRTQLQQQLTILVHLALTDETWAAARAVIDPIESLHYPGLPYGIGILGLEALPRLIEAYEAKGPTKQARWLYRQAIVAAIAVAASRGEGWPAEHDRFLAVDESWWFPRSQYILGNWHNDLMLSMHVMPLLRVAIAGLPTPRAHAILDTALDEMAPKKFPMCFFALPLLITHWRPGYLERAIRATRLGEDALKGSFIDSVPWRRFHDDLSDLGLLEKVLIERYKTGHSRHQFELDGIQEYEKFFKKAKKLLPATQFPRFEKNYKAMYAVD